MANTIIHKKSAVPAKVPLASDLSLGELAINTADGVVYLKKADDSVVAVGTGGGGGAGLGSAAPLANGTASAGVSASASHEDHIHPTDTTRAPLAAPVFTDSLTVSGVVATTRTLYSTRQPMSGSGAVHRSIEGYTSLGTTVTNSVATGVYGRIVLSTASSTGANANTTYGLFGSCENNNGCTTVPSKGEHVGVCGLNKVLATDATAKHFYKNYGGLFTVDLTGSSTATFSSGVYGSSSNLAAVGVSSIPLAIGSHISYSLGTTPVTNGYGIKLELTKGSTTSLWSIHSDSADANMYHPGKVRIGGTEGVPTSQLDIVGDVTHSTPAVDDNSTKSATTAFIQGQKAASVPLMNGTAAAGSSSKWAPADHVHPADTTKQATLVSGTNIKTVNGAALLGAGDVMITSTDAPATTATASSSAGVLTLTGTSASTILVTLTENITSIVLPAGAAGVRKDLMIQFTQDATGGRTVTGWPGSATLQWQGGVAPTISSVASTITQVAMSNASNTMWVGYNTPSSGIQPVARVPATQRIVAGAIGASALSTIAATASRIQFIPYVPARRMKIASIGFSVSTLLAGTATVGIYASDGNALYDRPGTRLASCTTGAISTSTTGTKTAAVAYVLEPGIMYFIAVICTAACTLRGVPLAGQDCMLGWTDNGTTNISSYYNAGATNVLPATAAAPTVNAGVIIPALYLIEG